MVRCENLVKIYKFEDIEVVALQGLDITVHAGEMVSIIGPSGSGKSSLLNVLGGLDSPTAGNAWVADLDLVRLDDKSRREYRRTTVGFVWQNVSRNLVPYLSARENVEMPMILQGSFARGRASELLRLVGLGDRLRHTPSRMSGGEQQRVAIAIALANDPKILLADEPTGSIDSATRDRIIGVFDTVRRELGITVLIVTHDREIAQRVDRYIEIRDGKTSREAVRRSDAMLESNYGSRESDDSEDDDESTHELYTLLDSAGRLQIPRELLSSRGISDRVKLTEDGEKIIIMPPTESAPTESAPTESGEMDDTDE